MKRRKSLRPLLFGLWVALAVFVLTAYVSAASISTALFNYKMTITADQYSGTDSLANFPALIRIPAEFAAHASSDNGSDLRIVDATGEMLPLEIEEWNPESTSLVWVRVPVMKANALLTAYIGSTNPGDVPSESVWSDYAAVFHMDETESGGIAMADATGNTTAGAHSKSIVREGVIGSARGRTDATGKNGAMMTVTNCPALNTAPSFTVSGWLYPTAKPTWSYLFARKNSDGYKSWGWQFRSSDGLSPIGIYSCGTIDNDSDRNIFSSSAITLNTWTKYDVVWQDTSVSLYLNSTLIGTQTIKPTDGMAIDGNLDLTIGGLSGDGHGTLKAYHDEFRIAKSSLSANWIAADYAQTTNANYYSYGEILAVDLTAIVFDGAPSVSEQDGQLVLSVKVAEDSGTGTLSAIYGSNQTFSTTNTFAGDVVAGTTYTCLLDGLADNTSYDYGVIGVNEKGTIQRTLSNDAFYNGTPQLTAGVAADEINLNTPGTIIVSRADTNGDLTVNYTVSGTAVAGVNYVALPGKVTIPNGQTSANIEVYPLRAKDGDHTVVVTLETGAYLVGAMTVSAQIDVKTFQTPEGWNTWIAREAGNASNADNWSDGVPKPGDKVLFDARFSNADCSWDVVHADGKAVLAAWSQSGDENAYTGTIVFETTYPEAEGALKTVEITGDVDLQSGTWTHLANAASEQYRLHVITGGALILGADATLTAAEKGYAKGTWPSGSAAGSHSASGSGSQYVYGDVYRPSNCGAGSSAGAGGGAIWIEAAGAATINGVVDVRGFSGDNKQQAAAGSFYLKAASCNGSGKVYANVKTVACYSGAYGSGGRVAIELTGAETLDFPVGNVALNGTNSGATGGGCGTLFVRTADATQPNGKLYLNDGRQKSYGARWQKITAIATIPAGQTWTFDEIQIANYGMLAVPAGTKLVLPNGPQSVSATSSFQGGIVANGGEIDFGEGPWTFSNQWIFHPNAEYVFDGDVTIAKNGAIGCLVFQGWVADKLACRLKVTGNLTIDDGGYLLGNGRGPDENQNRNTTNVGHGGQTVRNASSLAYGSVFSPVLAGMSLATGDQATSRPGGASLQIEVGGTLTNNGTIGADGYLNANEGAPGGSINITAGELTGSGSISARSYVKQSWQGTDDAYVSTGGGRIAVRLTNSSIGTDGIWANISAAGTTYSITSTNYTYASSSAGTIYLQGANQEEKTGTILVASDGNGNNPSYTTLPSLLLTDDTVADYEKATLSIAKCGKVRLFDELKMEALNIETDSRLDLNGHSLQVKAATIDGTRLKSGIYTADSMIDGLGDTSETLSGSLLVFGGELFIILR